MCPSGTRCLKTGLSFPNGPSPPLEKMSGKQGCQMVCFQTKNPNLGKFWRVFEWKMLVYFRDTWSILRSFVIFYGHLVYFPPFWYLVQKNLAALVAKRR
jgi:hypothetical protein